MDMSKNRNSGGQFAFVSILRLRKISFCSGSQDEQDQGQAGKHAGSKQHHDQRNFHGVTFSENMLL